MCPTNSLKAKENYSFIREKQQIWSKICLALNWLINRFSTSCLHSPCVVTNFIHPSPRQMASARDPGTGQEQKDAADQNFDYMFKLLIIGNSSVGKTSFLFRYADDSFTSAFVSTVGIDFKVKTIYRNDKRVKLQIWVWKIYRDTRKYYRYINSINLCMLVRDHSVHFSVQGPASGH